MRPNWCLTLGLFFALLSSATADAQTPAGAPGGDALGERLAALKQSLAKSQQNLRTYQWVETTSVSLKGEVKSTTQSSCYYGADGALQKTPISASPPPEQKRGLRGAIAQNKKEELTDTMKQAVALVKLYVPPNPALIQKSKDTGNMSLEVLQPGKVVRLVFRNYQLPGDNLGNTVDLATNTLSGISVGTYLGKPSTPVTLNVQMGTLMDGTGYPANIQLAVPSQNLSVAVTNTGYRKLN
jgi:hypothetical protein